jgi:hypothetical protein
MSAPAVHPPQRLRPARVFAYGGFAIMLVGWLAFAIVAGFYLFMFRPRGDAR